jgi:hypothetical protein
MTILSREQTDALSTVLCCFCDTWDPNRVSVWAEERNMTEDEIEEAVRQIQGLAGLSLV